MVSVAYVLLLLEVVSSAEAFQTWKFAKKVVVESTVAGALPTGMTMLRGEWDPNNDNPGLTQGLDLTNNDETCYPSNMDMDIALDFIHKPEIFYKAAKSAAHKQARQVVGPLDPDSTIDPTTDAYLQEINEKFDSIFNSDEVLCGDAIHFEALDAMLNHPGRFTFLTGGTNLGKSKAIDRKIEEFESNGLLCVEVNGRVFPGDIKRGLQVGLANAKAKHILSCLVTDLRIEKPETQERVVNFLKGFDNVVKKAMTQSMASEAFLKLMQSFFADMLEKYLSESLLDATEFDQKALLEGALESIQHAFKNIIPTSNDQAVFLPEPSKLVLDEILVYADDHNLKPVVIFDAANRLLEAIDGSNYKLTAEQEQFYMHLFDFLTMATKEKRMMSVLFVFSSTTFMKRVAQFLSGDFYNTIYYQEPNPQETFDCLTTQIGMGEELATLMIAAHGGRLFDIMNANRQLSVWKSRYTAADGLPPNTINKILATYPEAESILQELAKNGIAPATSDEKLVNALADTHTTTVPLSRKTKYGIFDCDDISGEFILPTKQSMRLAYFESLKQFKQEAKRKQQRLLRKQSTGRRPVTSQDDGVHHGAEKIALSQEDSAATAMLNVIHAKMRLAALKIDRYRGQGNDAMVAVEQGILDALVTEQHYVTTYHQRHSKTDL